MTKLEFTHEFFLIIYGNLLTISTWAKTIKDIFCKHYLDRIELEVEKVWEYSLQNGIEQRIIASRLMEGKFKLPGKIWNKKVTLKTDVGVSYCCIKESDLFNTYK